MANPIVTFTMENGDVMKAELYPEIAPTSVNNFVNLVQNGFYDGLIFHRVIAGFMIQGGDPEASDESESTVYDNSNDYNADDKAEELTEEEVVAGFEFETGKEPEEEQYPEDVPMFKQKRLEDR